MDYELPEDSGCLKVFMGACDDQILAETDVMGFVVSDLFDLLATILRIV